MVVFDNLVLQILVLHLLLLQVTEKIQPLLSGTLTITNIEVLVLSLFILFANKHELTVWI